MWTGPKLFIAEATSASPPLNLSSLCHTLLLYYVRAACCCCIISRRKKWGSLHSRLIKNVLIIFSRYSQTEKPGPFGKNIFFISECLVKNMSKRFWLTFKNWKHCDSNVETWFWLIRREKFLVKSPNTATLLKAYSQALNLVAHQM